MSTITGTKTITSTQSAVFAGSSQLAGRVQVYVKNLDDSVAIIFNGRPVEPGEASIVKPLLSSAVLYAQSTGRAVQALVQEVSL